MKEENTLMSFSSEEFGEVRTVVIDGKPWFFGKDVAKALGYARHSDAVNMHVKKRHRKALKYKAFGDSPLSKTLWCDNDFSDKIFIDEPGVYALIFQCKLENAERFQDWVYEEVLPAIRRTGEYKFDKKDKVKIKSKDDTELWYKEYKQFYADVVDADNKFDRIKAMCKFDDHMREGMIEILEMDEKEIKRLTDDRNEYCYMYYKLLELMKSEDNLKRITGTMDLMDAAKCLCRDGVIIGEKQLKNILRSQGVFTLDNKPYQRYIELGWFLMSPIFSEYEVKKLITVTKIGLVELNKMVHKYFGKSMPNSIDDYINSPHMMS